ncbi:hypothetical protein F4778DRAFT_772365 [Xylariomycetidae sp. FL2044]|nr:hypothetical protein F4778DRAFT_772365 [Xylariomycetidae sp. FL2044]
MASMVLYPHDGVDTSGSPAPMTPKANQACSSCKKQKRKCDKAVPSCGLCTRMGRLCDYSEVPPPPTAEEFQYVKDQLEEMARRMDAAGASGPSHNRLSAHSEPISHRPASIVLSPEPLWPQGPSIFPSSFFLDGPLFAWNGLPGIPAMHPDVPLDVIQCIGDEDAIRQIVSDYMEIIQPWMPMVSKYILNNMFALWDGCCGNALFFLAMKLVCSHPQDGLLASENYLYTTAKRFAAFVESTGLSTLRYLQALVMIALYEYGHGIYPAVWMTVGQCVRYADFIGLPSYKDSNAAIGQCSSWAEAEERRRTWWAVYVLDRIICIGSQKRPLCGEPSPHEILPVDDAAWDLGDSTLTMQRTVSTPGTEPQSPFARLCQAALLVGKMLRHAQRAEVRRQKGEAPDYAQVTSVTDAAEGLCTCLEAEFAAASPGISYLSFIGPQYLALSTILKVLSAHSGIVLSSSIAPNMQQQEHHHQQQHQQSQIWPTSSDLAFQVRAMETQKQTAARVRDYAASLFQSSSSSSSPSSSSHGDQIQVQDQDLARTTPFVLDAVYAAAATFAWARRGAGQDPLADAGLEAMKGCLARLGGRWRLAGEYLKLVGAHEMNVAMGRGIAGLLVVPNAI